MAYRRAARTTRRVGKSRRTSSPRRSNRSYSSASKARKSRTTSQRRAPAQTLKIVIEHASVNEAARPIEERPMGDGTIIKKPTKSQF